MRNGLFPYITSFYIYNFSFKRFYIGLVGRLIFSVTDYKHWYGEPQNWLINHDFSIEMIEEEKSLLRSSCQYILLENYNIFQINEECNPYSHVYYNYIMYKKSNKYPGQIYNEDEFLDKIKYETALEYTTSDEIIYEDITRYKKNFDSDYNSKIGQIWKNLCIEYEDTRWYYQESLHRKLEEELLKEEL